MAELEMPPAVPLMPPTPWGGQKKYCGHLEAIERAPAVPLTPPEAWGGVKGTARLGGVLPNFLKNNGTVEALIYLKGPGGNRDPLNTFKSAGCTLD